MRIEVDDNSGFCFGVVTAIEKAEEQLEKSGTLYCLGDIVHNASEVERLRVRGLMTITHAELRTLKDATVLLRAHGEPPSTYSVAEENNIRVIDATCPVVLQLQRRIKEAYAENLRRRESGEMTEMPLILIYGKEGHAEVNGLVGQTNGEAIVIQNADDLDSIDLSRDILLYSQTTKSLDGFRHIVEEIKARKQTGGFEYFDTICRQVANRLSKLREFAASHDAIVFVSGAKSSNGKVLFEECRKVNTRSYLVSDGSGLDMSLLEGADSIGICGATSTPRWLMADIAELIKNNLEKES
ncbi:4-hydroxy-3-methylbut-2-enyl diphosphate reductase [Muribaculaceae bacterium]|jgi:4-hydroxy-3-methylbut-2-enyl diphosphate reductase|uniref:4-hydroxy-3-methylbut-2-enyl diphosphate reductase n=1 Tax=Barnesiella sp. CU968 TaxID=2780099 RepID=UPI000FFE915F|nr:4-hydroxy-3-methylbut-2-enyl diphosphate reductase [Barnesiella sp. CU968]MBJ2196417.1 4-hydroxy-3-methylbut-2-enyl diphosphate reductase [Muribaculaceae bacterium]MCI9028809.1 4-hydroxy-3-methylbut-2-enyl diphosphate reductase [Muribaculaceae bacterium]RXE68528.1 4-hydroxy-3-methylbut-2-enyl diphosphate reductase [Muribaculaceae bacterium Isolate-001 (NCI)]GFI58351.1 4-hydroxy-3-methylbut-2-enyl diphosphate reductase [Muribaculaceae bacterium]